MMVVCLACGYSLYWQAGHSRINGGGDLIGNRGEYQALVRKEESEHLISTRENNRKTFTSCLQETDHKQAEKTLQTGHSRAKEGGGGAGLCPVILKKKTKGQSLTLLDGKREINYVQKKVC